MSPIVSSQDCDPHNSLTLLYHQKLRMGYFSICAKTTKEKDIHKNLLEDHRQAQALERKKSMHHREKSLKKPEQYMCLMIDGMDQKKMCLPDLRQLLKDLNDKCLVQMHLVGCFAYNGIVKPHAFITYPNVHNDPNLTFTMIQNGSVELGGTRYPLFSMFI